MISLNYRDSRPIYEQIRDGLRKLIVTGALSADEKLPSVRALADSARRAELLTQVRELLSELRYLGVSQQELLNLVKEASPS